MCVYVCVSLSLCNSTLGDKVLQTTNPSGSNGVITPKKGSTDFNLIKLLVPIWVNGQLAHSSVCVCVCVCLCMRRRGGETEGIKWSGRNDTRKCITN